MEDYVSGEGLFEKEENNLLMFVASNDPMSFEEAIKSPKWREAMDLEVKVVEKNGTWDRAHYTSNWSKENRSKMGI